MHSTTAGSTSGTTSTTSGALLLPPPSPVDVGVPGTLSAERPRRFNAAACAKGDEGERMMEEILDLHLGTCCVVLHNRCRPGTTGNIDHIVIAPSGVWVIDTKAWSGDITCCDRSTWDGPRVDLLRNGRKRTKEIAGIHEQADDVRHALAAIGMGNALVEEAICFVTLSVAPSGMPQRVGTAWALSPTELVVMIGATSHLAADAMQTIAHHLSTAFPPKSSAVSPIHPMQQRPSLQPPTDRQPTHRESRPTARQSAFSPGTRQLVEQVANASPLLHTVSQNKPNRIVAVRDDGVIVETDASKASGNDTPLTPAWMIEVAWAHLRSTGLLEQAYLKSPDGLQVRRSSFVMALLAQFPGVSVSLHPACLHYRLVDA